MLQKLWAVDAEIIHQTRNNKGAALVQVLIVLVALSILGAALISLSNIEVWKGESSNKQKQAYYYARSGVEMARRLFANDLEGRIDKLPFYLYGSLEDAMTEASDINEDIKDNNPVVTMVTGTVSGITTRVTIHSIGTFDGVKKTVTYNFTYTKGTGPIPPDTGTGGDGVMAGPEGINWYDRMGALRSGSGFDPVSEKQVVFDVAIAGGYVYDRSEGTPVFTAPGMFFTDTPLSLMTTKNKSTILKTDILVFYGNIIGEDEKSTINILTNNSNITGEDIPGAHSGTSYGIIYLSTDVSVSVQSSGVLLFPTAEKSVGYYFFPSGVNLLSAEGISSLIKIDDINLLDPDLLNKLGSEINTGGKLTEGTYK